ncbi:type II and III secretion system protein family protein [Qipengyuania thermophila]|uniref:type II and III secretion system protein family protein n=1 Tax=Qipengyuania thermophila TaxID=2509361 RepID=UPI001F1A6607|nr:type II and III secretion system protein family protein [Qipengyuania thermophila]
MKRLTATLLVATAALLPTPAFSGAAQAQAASPARQTIVMSIGKGQLITIPGTMSDIFVADDRVADVQVKSRNQLYVFGKAGGETTLYASNAAGDIVWSANVRVGSNIDSIDQMLALAMPDAQISVATMGTNTVLLTGTVAAPEDAAEAQRLVQAFTGENFNVISRLRMAVPLQVNLQVRIAEVRRDFVRAIGVNLASGDSTGGFQFGIAGGRGAFPQYTPGGPLGTGLTEGADGSSIVSRLGGATTIAAFGRFLGLDIASALDLAEQQGLVTTLAQPNLTALSGETADFLAGGEFPIPIPQGIGQTTIEYKNFGVSLAYTPTVLANGRISLRVRPEVSELSSSGAVVLNGFRVPALTTRRAETTVELGSGQSFMIAGLLSNSAQNTLEKAPILGDLPIVGNLFRSRSFRRGETELVIIVTPYLVRPVNARDVRLPTDGFRAPTEAQAVLGFQENDGVSGAVRPEPTARDAQGQAPGVSPGISHAHPPAPAAARSGREQQRAEAAVPGFSFNPKGN